MHDGFYLDIGAFDAIYASNTLNLYVHGWDGISVEASPQRLSKFFTIRPDQTNINLAIGDSDSFVSLYEMKDDSMSTVSSVIKDRTQNQFLSSQSVPSMSLKSLC